MKAYIGRWLQQGEGLLSGFPNLRIRTFGGRQVWGDIYYHYGWRIQENVLTGHFRLLSPKNVRHAWGSYDHCLIASRQAIAAEDTLLPPEPDHLVVVLHGLARTRSSMAGLVKELRKGGLHAIALAYPSTRQSASEHAARLSRLLNTLDTRVTKVSFVTHSLGGIVVRHLLALNAPWRQRLQIGGAVLIAPPNQGAHLARLLKNNVAFRLIAGPAGQNLANEQTAIVPPLTDRHMVIAGVRGKEQGYNPLLTGDDDGIVSLTETDLGPNTERILVKSIHTLIMQHPDTVKAVLAFLRARAEK